MSAVSQLQFQKAHKKIASKYWGILLLIGVTILSWSNSAEYPVLTSDLLRTLLGLSSSAYMTYAGYRSLFYITLPDRENPLDRNIRPTQNLCYYLGGSGILAVGVCFILVQIYDLFWWSLCMSLLVTYIYHSYFAQKTFTRFLVRNAFPQSWKNFLSNSGWGESLLRDMQNTGYHQPVPTSRFATYAAGTAFFIEIYLLHFV